MNAITPQLKPGKAEEEWKTIHKETRNSSQPTNQHKQGEGEEKKQ